MFLRRVNQTRGTTQIAIKRLFTDSNKSFALTRRTWESTRTSFRSQARKRLVVLNHAAPARTTRRLSGALRIKQVFRQSLYNIDGYI